MEKEIKITKTKREIPAIWVGGGAFTSTFKARWLLHPDGNLKMAMFTKRGGNLANSLEQALVAIKVQDIYVEMEGSLPVERDNPDLELKAWEVIAIKDEKALLKEYNGMTPMEDLLPDEAIEGCNTYHNRDGNKFALKRVEKEE